MHTECQSVSRWTSDWVQLSVTLRQWSKVHFPSSSSQQNRTWRSLLQSGWSAGLKRNHLWSEQNLFIPPELWICTDCLLQNRPNTQQHLPAGKQHRPAHVVFCCWPAWCVKNLFHITAWGGVKLAEDTDPESVRSSQNTKFTEHELHTCNILGSFEETWNKLKILH